MNQRALVVLVDPVEDANTVSALLGRALRPAGEGESVYQPPAHLLGDQFWREPEAREWWAGSGLDGVDAVVVTCDRPGLELALADVDTQWVVWCRDPERAKAFAGDGGPIPLCGRNPHDFVEALAVRLRTDGWTIAPAPTWGPFTPRTTDPEATAHWVVDGSDAAAAMPHVTARAAAPPPLPAMRWEAVCQPTRDASVPVPTAPVPSPVISADLEVPPRAADLLAALNAGDHATLGRLPSTSGARRSLRERLSSVFGIGDRVVEASESELAQILTAHHDTLIVVGSRKGGVGKTTESLGLGYLAADAVGPLGGRALVLDANVTNADISVKLRLPHSAATVREAVRAVMEHAVVPPPSSVQGSALRVYGERRETASYTPLEITELVHHIRAEYTVAVVDFPNAVPGADDKAGGVVESWLPHADVVVIPIDTSIASFEGAADMLAAITDLKDDLAGAYDPGIVIAFLAPTDINARRMAPELDATLRQLEALGARVVEIPASSRMAMADWSEHPTPLTTADPAVTRAYWRLLAGIAAVRGTTTR